MEIYNSVERTFDAGHVIPGHPACGVEHGHRYKVRVTVLVPTSTSVDTYLELDDELELLLAEVDHRSLNTMLPGMIPSLDGIAMWVIERLVNNFPKITTVEVWLDERQRVTVKRPLR